MDARTTEQPARIVVVEDNGADVYLLRRALQQARVSYVMDHLTDGEEALDFFLRRGKHKDAPRPDLLVLDLHLPKIDGSEVLRSLQGHDALRGVPVIVFSTSSSPPDRAAVGALPVARYVVKSSDLDTFMQIGQIIKDMLTVSDSSAGGGGTLSERTAHGPAVPVTKSQKGAQKETGGGSSPPPEGEGEGNVEQLLSYGTLFSMQERGKNIFCQFNPSGLIRRPERIERSLRG
jgi:CheY-like chemotaxis protein